MWPWRLFGRRRGFFVGLYWGVTMIFYAEAGIFVSEKEANSGNND